MNINTTAGNIVHIVSINVPCTKYLCEITLFVLANSIQMETNRYITPATINDIKTIV
jgi:hypothetical protein